MEFQTIESSRKIKGIEDDNWMSITEIVDEVEHKKVNINCLKEKIYYLEEESQDLSEGMTLLTDTLATKDVEMVKLEYQNKVLVNENA